MTDVVVKAIVSLGRMFVSLRLAFRRNSERERHIPR